jgi:hypothetical protein
MDWKRVTDRAKQVIDERGGTKSLKEDADELRDIAQGPGTLADKAKAAAEALREPGGHREPGAGSEPGAAGRAEAGGEVDAGGEAGAGDVRPASGEPAYEDEPRQADPPTDYGESDE